MEYRKLPHGEERISTVGLGTGSLIGISEDEIEALILKALDNGINFFDLCASAKRVYEPFGRAIKTRRESVYFQLHFGAVYNSEGEYAWSRDVNEIKSVFEWEMNALQTDYADFGFLHCVDENEDFDKILDSGLLDYLKELKKQGRIRHLGFSSHTPSVSNRVLDTGLMDMLMFSLNPAYDFERGDELGIGTVHERFKLFGRCAAEGVGISVMKPFHGGKLLTAETSPFGEKLTHYQCIQYALDRPGVLCVVPGVRNMDDLNVLLGFSGSTAEERDYSVIGGFTAGQLAQNCVYCNHCQPCPAGIDIGLVNKYYDLARVGDKLAVGHYEKLKKDATACLHCGHCDSRCPFGVKQSERMEEIAAYFTAQ
ncbi:MAG: aldo/keto reductase [Clostridia bacterium]|nr:aldo/keto reductase [Clostridia bacterium]